MSNARIGMWSWVCLTLGMAMAAQPLVAAGQLVVLSNQEPQHVFAGAARNIPVLFRNAGESAVATDIQTKLFQASSATAMPLGATPWKKLHVLPGQTVVEHAALTFPAVNAETHFLVQWVEGTNRVIGSTEVLVYPTNLLAELKPLAGEEPLGVFDPENQLKPLLKNVGVEFTDLEDAGMEAYVGKLVIVGPFRSKEAMRDGLANQIRTCAKRGVAVVRIQPPPELRPPSEHREPIKPSFYVVTEGRGTVVVVQASLVSDLPENPQAQLNLIRLARLALNPEPLALPFMTPPR